MMNRLKKFGAMLCMLTFLYGCVEAGIGLLGAGVGIGAYKYIEGRLVREYPLSYSQAWDATNRALENLKISISNSIDEGLEGKIEAVRKDGKKVSIQLKDKGQGVTSISIRVGLLGDRLLAKKIHDEIARVAGIQ